MKRTTTLAGPASRTNLLARLIDAPDLVRGVRALPAAAFATLVRELGVEDAGPVVALATTEQLVAAFDADLFTSERAGQRETFAPERFATWLEVLLEAGEQVAARRVAELSEDFVAQGLSSLVLVLDNDALMLRMAEGGAGALAADKAIESALSEELDGYLLISRRVEGWDAALALVLALDRDHRDFLTRVLDRCVAAAGHYVDELEALAGVLDSAAALADDVEAEREERRSHQGYVEPRAARSFLALAGQPLTGDAATAERDPVTRAYFRHLVRDAAPPPAADAAGPPPGALDRALEWLQAAGHLVGAPAGLLAPPAVATSPGQSGVARLFEALRTVAATDQRLFRERLEELAYLTNVVLSGAEREGRRFRPAEAADAVLATVALGAAVEAGGLVQGSDDLDRVVRRIPADLLFRRAVAVCGQRTLVPRSPAILLSEAEVAPALSRLGL